ncbi:MAG: hypothetical protein AVDCRST_MAG02-2520 [uncultured Rubrobacteraceae bacterium]|nr:MAG: hypothetical protein AVDCRST_MAG02-2520 [uncultured Rubrobacteraceae bacterium]
MALRAGAIGPSQPASARAVFEIALRGSGQTFVPPPIVDGPRTERLLTGFAGCYAAARCRPFRAHHRRPRQKPCNARAERGPAERVCKMKR